jgi:ABC-type dipeptide/oligopeptide/nickel transport system ATPase subunit
VCDLRGLFLFIQIKNIGEIFMAILEVKHLKKSFGEKIIFDDINFSVDAGECFGIVGRSGCGKSTLVKIIARFIPADSGEIFLDGENITNEKNLKSVYAKMQMIFQMPEDSFDPRKTLGWSIAEPMRNFNFKNIEERTKNLLIEVGLTPDFVEKYPHEVSGGQCQRAAIARAISLSPKLLICDEVTSALDVTTQAQIINLLNKLRTEKQIAILFITHDLKLLEKIGGRVFKFENK